MTSPHDRLRLRRHDWVWLDADPDPALICAQAADGGALTAAWRGAGRPFVVARRLPGDPAEFIRLGLATPEKRRVGLLAPVSAVARTATAPLLAEAARASCAPPPWGQSLGALAERLADAGFAARVFGSLAWGFFTGLPYVRPDSDVDLLFEPDSWEGAVRLADLLSAENPPPGAPRLDGEIIILPGGWGVAWRELAARPAAVLLKGEQDAVLRPYSQLAELFNQERAAA